MISCLISASSQLWSCVDVQWLYTTALVPCGMMRHRAICVGCWVLDVVGVFVYVPMNITPTAPCWSVVCVIISVVLFYIGSSFLLTHSVASLMHRFGLLSLFNSVSALWLHVSGLIGLLGCSVKAWWRPSIPRTHASILCTKRERTYMAPSRETLLTSPLLCRQSSTCCHLAFSQE